jgi:fatty acid desaturase
MLPRSPSGAFEPPGRPPIRAGRLSPADRIELARLRREFREAGWHVKPTARLLGHLCLQVAAVMGGLALVVVGGHLLIDVAGFMIATAGAAGVATHTHNSSHHATSSRRWVNHLLTYFGYPLFTGLSATYWRHKHLAIHHRAPNVMGVDDDADLTPWFVLTTDQADQAHPLARFYYRRLQAWVFPLALAMNGFNIQRVGWVFLWGAVRRPGRRPEHLIDLACMIAHYALWIGLPLVWFAPLEVVAVYGIRIGLMGYAMFAILAPGHFPAEAVRTSPAAHIDALTLQTGATINFRTGPIGRLMCCGLEYQIEHHLFPEVSYVHYPAVSIVVKQFCERRHLPYRCYPWHVALWKSWKIVFEPGQVQHAGASLRWEG